MAVTKVVPRKPEKKVEEPEVESDGNHYLP